MLFPNAIKLQKTVVHGGATSGWLLSGLVLLAKGALLSAYVTAAH